MDHFTNDIIRTYFVWPSVEGIADRTRVGKELAAISATPTPDPKDWVFSSANNRFVDPHGGAGHATPEEWVNRGTGRLQAALSGF